MCLTSLGFRKANCDNREISFHTNLIRLAKSCKSDNRVIGNVGKKLLYLFMGECVGTVTLWRNLRLSSRS